MTHKLDLHGVKHQDVDILVENFIYSKQDNFPLIIICGNSVKMVNLVKKVIDRIDCEYSMYRFGVFNIHRFK
jgi:hypothetical protein